MRLLVVARSDSIHTARWINQVRDQGWDIHLFPSVDYGFAHPALKDITIHHSFFGKRVYQSHSRHRGIPLISEQAAGALRMLFRHTFPKQRTNQLCRLIERLKPDLIHSMEFQAAGYMTLAAKERLKDFPTWLATNWGNDIYLFGRLPEHRERVQRLLASCDYYSCEGERDVTLAREYGFKGETFPPFPNTGGFDLQAVEELKQSGPTSARKCIMLKGYQGWAGRALVGLRALERCADILQGYTIYLYSVTDESVQISAELFRQDTGISLEIIPPGTSHEEMLRHHGKSRISIGTHISDGVATSFLEALVMGAFPIQTWTATADEWIEDGKTGILIPPNDPDVIEQAIRRALTDDALVDNAAKVNQETAKQRLDHQYIKTLTLDMYQKILASKR